ncbi:LysE family translocator [Rhizobacter sp. Root16D2]|uniref:LysE family translocator n=1 Tax=Rhizobacter sp. Root16D2 TaxID=1736479 RepID=UPI0006FBEF34|nr:LysE family translocator [Rhizobacter sp. Root16D2]KRB24928.1 hypothetical protein ASE08_01695 [Rhizobacter sp. Root16D2]
MHLDTLTANPNLAVACTAYFIGCASPGPSIVALMGTAMNGGRAPALALAAGITLSSWTLGLTAALGLASLLAAWSGALMVVKVIGGLYLLWLAFKAGRSALSRHDAADAGASGRTGSLRQVFLKGIAMHITNPKAIFVWLSTISMGLPAHASPTDSLVVFAVCGLLGVLIFVSYALLFSTAVARRIYRSTRRAFDSTIALFFGFAGLRMLLSRHL